MLSGERNYEGIFALDSFQDFCALVAIVIFCGVALCTDAVAIVLVAAGLLP